MRNRRSHEGGYVLVAALLAAGLILAAGLAVLSRTTTEVKVGRSAEDYERAWQAAMAGIEHCLAYIRHETEGQERMKNPVAGAQVCEKSHSAHGASYTARAVAANARQAKVVSTGTAGKHSRTAAAIIRYTLASGKGLQAWGGGNMKFAGGGTLDGEIFTAKDIEVTGNFTVCGNIYASGTAFRGSNVSDASNCNVGFHSRFPFIQFPDFEVDKLKSRAAIIYTSDYTALCPPIGTRDPGCDGPTSGEKVVWVKGKLTLGKSGSDSLYTGRIIYVADNGVDVVGKNHDLGNGAMLQVVAAGADKVIKVTSSGTVQGVFAAPEGRFETPGTVRLNGLVFAKDWNNSGTLHWVANGQRGACTGEECVAARMAIVKLWEQ